MRIRPRSIFIQLFMIFFSISSLYALTADEELNIKIYKELGNGVVNITSTPLSYEAVYDPVPEGGGSGFIIDKKGTIVTNFHVAAGGRGLEVTLHDGSKYEPEIIGTDPDNDLAILRIKAPAELLNPISLGDSAGLKVGQKVLAIGNPFGLDRTLTVGIISSLGRTMKAPNDKIIRGIIQTDAAINPGNSGGPLLDSSGKVIAVNTALFSPVEGSVGIGFATPVNILKKVLPQILEKGYVSRPWLGITGPGIGKNLAEILELPSEGMLVADVMEGSSAAKVGIKGADRFEGIRNVLVPLGGDFIVAVDGKKVKSQGDLDEIVESKSPGKSVEMTIYRGGKKMELTVLLVERPRE